MDTMRSRICGQVNPTDIKVYYEDGQPYISYKGEFVGDSGEWEIEIPKMSMVLNALERIIDMKYEMDFRENITRRMPVCNQFFATHDVAYVIRSKKAKMTKADIERELGYRVDIIGE